MPAPTLQGGAPAPAQAGQAAAPAIPFTRASRQKSRLVGQYAQTLTTSVSAQSPIQVPAAGYLRKIRLEVTGTADNTPVGTAAAPNVVFKNDAPFNVLQQVSLLSANGDSLIAPIDGFSLYLLNKYGAFAQDRGNPVSSPTYRAIVGTGTTAGSFRFIIDIPIELDSRDALGALQNMAANQSFLLQFSYNAIAQIYSTSPVNAPRISVRATMDYWSAPAPSNANGDVQSIAPNGNGTVSLIQTQTPSVTAGTSQNIQLLNVGNTVRLPIFVLRGGDGERTEADWPDVTQFYVNNDPWFYKTKGVWQDEMAQAYGLTEAPAVRPSATALDAGVYVLPDFIKDGSAGNQKASASCNRNLWLVTGSATALNVEASTPWGSGARSLLVLQNNVRPASPAALYAPQWI